MERMDHMDHMSGMSGMSFHIRPTKRLARVQAVGASLQRFAKRASKLLMLTNRQVAPHPDASNASMPRIPRRSTAWSA